METVTGRIDTVFKTIIMSAIDFLKLSDFEKIQLDDRIVLNKKENLDASIVGRTVDYMSRLAYSHDFKKSFYLPLIGLAIAAERKKDNTFFYETLEILWKDMSADVLSDKAITATCRLASFDVWERNPSQAIKYHNIESINPDHETAQNIRCLLKRTLYFYNRERIFYNRDTVKFDDGYLEGGFTDTVGKGDFDFLTSDTLFDLKVVQEATLKRSAKKYILQILMYWIIGKHSGNEVFKDITKIGFFNPRSNAAYVLNMSKVSPDIIRFVEDYVICY